MEGIFSGPLCDSTSLTFAFPREGASSADLAEQNTPAGKRPSREMYSKERWQEVRPIIQQLYVEKRYTFAEVAKHLREHHNLNPTKKQFLTRISAWGYEKNVKHRERRAILESVGSATELADLEGRTVGGRKLYKAKIDRWRKLDGAFRGSFLSRSAQSSELSHPPSVLSEGPSILSAHHFRGQEETPEWCENQPKPVPNDRASTFNPWLLVDVVGSPGFTGLIGALTLEQCEDMPSLDLSGNDLAEDENAHDLVDLFEGYNSVAYSKAGSEHQAPEIASYSVASSIAALKPNFSKLSQQWIPGPLDELDPFPNLARPRMFKNHPKTNHLLSDYSLKAKELECRRKFKILKFLKHSQVDELVEDMSCIAWRHLRLRRYRHAEIWWRQVVTSGLEIRGHKPLRILRACLSVIQTIRGQGRYKEARSLHESLHAKITNLVGAEHLLALRSKYSLANSKIAFRDFQDFEATVESYRELLQICLLRLGTRSTDTIIILAGLGSGLLSCRRYSEAESILSIAVQLGGELSRHLDPDDINAADALVTVNNLALCLSLQQRYEDSESILRSAERWFKDLIRIENPASWPHFVEKARVLRAMGRRHESEKLLRTIIRHASDEASIYTWVFMSHLAQMLEETDRGLEETYWREKIFSTVVQTYGIEHKFSMDTCRNLGICYGKQRRYNDAIFHYQQTVEKLASSKDGDINSRAATIEEIQGWIMEVERMKTDTNF